MIVPRAAAWLLALGALAPAARGAEPAARTELTLSASGRSASAVLVRPADARALLVLGHGANMTRTSPFMTSLADALARKGVATLLFNFPYAEAGGAQPDPQPVLQATVRAAVAEADRRRGALPLLLGGKSLSTLVIAGVLSQNPPPVAGAVMLGFPLHAPGRPSARNARALDAIRVPLLFVQGTRDPLAELSLMQGVVERLGPRARLRTIQDADHQFERGASLEPQTVDEIADAIAGFAVGLAASGGGSKR